MPQSVSLSGPALALELILLYKLRTRRTRLEDYVIRCARAAQLDSKKWWEVNMNLEIVGILPESRLFNYGAKSFFICNQDSSREDVFVVV